MAQLIFGIHAEQPADGNDELAGAVVRYDACGLLPVGGDAGPGVALLVPVLACRAHHQSAEQEG
jgi:hypothetical protein